MTDFGAEPFVQSVSTTKDNIHYLEFEEGEDIDLSNLVPPQDIDNSYDVDDDLFIDHDAHLQD